MKIRQRKDDCHYETSIEKYQEGCSYFDTGGDVPIVIGYGITQEMADSDALKQFEQLTK